MLLLKTVDWIKVGFSTISPKKMRIRLANTLHVTIVEIPDLNLYQLALF